MFIPKMSELNIYKYTVIHVYPSHFYKITLKELNYVPIQNLSESKEKRFSILRNLSKDLKGKQGNFTGSK